MSKKTIFNVYITKISVIKDDDAAAWRTVYWQKNVKETTRTGAVKKCLNEIKDKVLPNVDNNIKFIAIYTGRAGNVTGAANRLEPIRINRQGVIVK
jgi:hypothetical protein